MTPEQITQQRYKLLHLLYRTRLEEDDLKFQSETPVSELTDALGDCTFNLGVLMEHGYVKKDGYKVRISGQGCLYFEQLQHGQNA